MSGCDMDLESEYVKIQKLRHRLKGLTWQSFLDANHINALSLCSPLEIGGTKYRARYGVHMKHYAVAIIANKTFVCLYRVNKSLMRCQHNLLLDLLDLPPFTNTDYVYNIRDGMLWTFDFAPNPDPIFYLNGKPFRLTDPIIGDEDDS